MKKKPYKLEIIEWGRIVKTYESAYIKPLVKAFRKDWLKWYQESRCAFTLYDREGKEIDKNKQIKIMLEESVRK